MKFIIEFLDGISVILYVMSIFVVILVLTRLASVVILPAFFYWRDLFISGNPSALILPISVFCFAFILDAISAFISFTIKNKDTKC